MYSDSSPYMKQSSVLSPLAMQQIKFYNIGPSLRPSMAGWQTSWQTRSTAGARSSTFTRRIKMTTSRGPTSKEELPHTIKVVHLSCAFVCVFKLFPVWPDLAKFRHFGTILKVLGKFLQVYLVFSKMWIFLWQKMLLLGKFSLF